MWHRNYFWQFKRPTFPCWPYFNMKKRIQEGEGYNMYLQNVVVQEEILKDAWMQIPRWNSDNLWVLTDLVFTFIFYTYLGLLHQIAQNWLTKQGSIQSYYFLTLSNRNTSTLSITVYVKKTVLEKLSKPRHFKE